MFIFIDLSFFIQRDQSFAYVCNRDLALDLGHIDIFDGPFTRFRTTDNEAGQAHQSRDVVRILLQAGADRLRSRWQRVS